MERAEYLAALPEIRAIYEGPNLSAAEVKKQETGRTAPDVGFDPTPFRPDRAVFGRFGRIGDGNCYGYADGIRQR